MATNQQNLQTALANCAAALAALYTPPRPDGSIDNESWQHTQMRLALLREMQSLREQILLEDAPFEITNYPFES